jgi:hypothetical protein
MTDEISLTFINEVITVIDSFQQDYGTFRYSITIRSYVRHHKLTVNIISIKSGTAVHFDIEYTTYKQAKVPSRYIYDLIKSKSDELFMKE